MTDGHEIPSVMIKVSPELLAKLEEWSEPVQIMIERWNGGEYTMVARTHHCEQR